MWLHRADGDVVRGLPNTRRVMPYMMRTRTESAVYFEYDASLAKTDRFISEWNQANPLPSHRRVPRVRVGGARRDHAQPEHEPVRRRRSPVPTQGPLVLLRREAEARDRVHRSSWSSTGSTPTRRSAPWSPGSRPMQADTVGPGRSTVDRELGLLLKFPSFVRRIIFFGLRALDRFGHAPARVHRQGPDVHVGLPREPRQPRDAGRSTTTSTSTAPAGCSAPSAARRPTPGARRADRIDGVR